MTDYYAHVSDGTVTAINIQKGGLFNGKRIGRLSTDAELAAMDLYPITGTRPTGEVWQTVAGPTYQWNAGTSTVERVYVVADVPLADYKTRRKADLAALRYDHEVGGTTISGMDVSTDRETQSKLIAARIMAKEDAAYTVAWKGPAGFATLDAATIIAVADGVRGHVQACFDREAALTATIDAATTVQAVAAVDITTGWPS